MQHTYAATRFCPHCGTQLDGAARFCPRCGSGQGQGQAPTMVAVPYPVYGMPAVGRKSRLAAILLAFFLGGFGVHKFYLGRVGAGIVYLLLFWTFIPAVVSIVEMIVYICMSDQEFAHKYG